MFFSRKINQYEFGTTLLFRASILTCFLLNLMNFLSFAMPPTPRPGYTFFCNPLSDINYFHLFALILPAILSFFSTFNLLIFGSNFKQQKQQFIVYLQNVSLLLSIFLIALVTFYSFPAHLSSAYYCRNMNYFFHGEIFVTFMGVICGAVAIYEVHRAKLIKKVFVKLHCYAI